MLLSELLCERISWIILKNNKAFERSEKLLVITSTICRNKSSSGLMRTPSTSIISGWSLPEFSWVYNSVLTFHDGGRYHIEISPLICQANQWTGFYMITASVMKGLNTSWKFQVISTFGRNNAHISSPTENLTICQVVFLRLKHVTWKEGKNK